MINYLARQRICHSCSFRLLSLFTNGFSSTGTCRGHVGKLSRQNGQRRGLQPHMRLFSSGNVPRASVEHEEHHEVELPRTMKQMEAIVRQARQTFGETLPHDFLLPKEYAIYERLYGPPSATTLPEDVDLLQGAKEEDYELPENVLMRENANGELEEVPYDAEDMDAAEDLDEAAEVHIQTQEDFRTRMAVLRDIAAAKSADLVQEAAALTEETDREGEQEEGVILEDQYYDDEDAQGYEEEDGVHRTGDSTRTHPLTAAGRFGTWPTTIQISKKTVTDPITDLLSDASNKHLKEVALKTFGGPGLPNSTATITRPNLKQRPIALEAKQAYMGDMECNAYMAAIMPGAYATVMSTLVEVRKRLGSGWLRSLMRKEGGPRVLDAGSGGAGVLAWREVLRAEWELMHPGGVPHDKAIPYGKSTVVTGSTTLRHRASHLLDNTTFIPRLPDYDPSRDHPSLESNNPQPRKQYDLILAPHTLWTLKEDYMRKGQVQNFWSLLDPKGGVLILAEKGVPRGFELIAGARETLLEYHVASPGAEQVEYSVEDTSESRFGPKEKGMIIAPCTNHGKCPMYITAGTSQGRKDFCHFSQRYLRPQYLQRILDGRDRNSEDIMFSYVALQRGVDQREKHGIVQGQPATEAAFEGYEEAGTQSQSPERQVWDAESEFAHVSTLSLPRAILPPIKRRGHVVLDLCTPAGKIERWTVPKSFSKQAYRDARKSKWGDLWALGAKTRVQRNIRVGLKTANSQRKDTPEAEAAQMDDDLTKKTRAPKSKFRKSPKREKSKLRY
ncbi:hypothetical protein JMJ35_007607 [Cladonia borealis]|uniref:37S ribosomal protein Rsm22 n=1 Tax=Cladonia borealis TaxID=184061 RepID=A0AA39QW12_9LECA|nr:hypothetical protein JMJ35_007607 [Cladonia borealis]